MTVYHCKGDLSFATRSKDIADLVQSWAWAGDKHTAPRCTYDLTDDVSTLVDVLHQCADTAILNQEANFAYPADMAEEQAEESDMPLLSTQSMTKATLGTPTLKK